MADHLIAGLHCADVLEDAPAFVLGALEASEMAAVREHLAGCPELHAEFAELGSVVPALFEVVDLVEPSAMLRDRIMTAAAADTQRTADMQFGADTERVGDTQRAFERTPVIERTPVTDTQRDGGRLPNLFRRPVWAAVGLAAALAIAALGAWNVQLQNQIDGLTAYRDGVVAVRGAVGG